MNEIFNPRGTGGPDNLEPLPGQNFFQTAAEGLFVVDDQNGIHCLKGAGIATPSEVKGMLAQPKRGAKLKVLIMPQFFLDSLPFKIRGGQEGL